MDIKSAKEFLKEKGLKNPPIDSGISGGGSAPRKYVSDIMKEYAKQFIDLAAEEAYVTVDTSEIPYTSSWSMISNAVINEKISVNKQSILKIKELIK